ncbi:MAG: hypothetical protein AAFU79_23015 [Myxococcota bacterium]
MTRGSTAASGWVRRSAGGLLLAGLVTSGCATNHVKNGRRLLWVNDSDSACTTVWLWGLLPTKVDVSEKKTTAPGERFDRDLQGVRFRQSFLESLVSVVTLGIFMPGRVEWDLAAPRLAEAREHTRPYKLDVEAGHLEVEIIANDIIGFEVENIGRPGAAALPGELPRLPPPFLYCSSTKVDGGRHVAKCGQAILAESRILISVGAWNPRVKYTLTVRNRGQDVQTWENETLDPSIEAQLSTSEGASDAAE